MLNLGSPNVTSRVLGEALIVAIHANQEAVALVLVDAGADVNVGSVTVTCINTNKNAHRRPALLETLRQKNVKLVWLILDADVVIDDPRENFLVEAVNWGNHDIIGELIAKGADVNAFDKNHNCTALVRSVDIKDTKMTYLLLDAGADMNAGPGKTALTAAVTNGDIEMVEHFLFIGADPGDSLALLQALSHGTPMIKKLLRAFKERYPHGKKGYGCRALQKAIREQNIPIIELFLKAKIDANSFDRAGQAPWNFKRLDPSEMDGHLTPLGTAIKTEHATSLTVTERLLNASGNPNSVVQGFGVEMYHKKTALLAAIGTNNIQKVQLLIDIGADVNWPATRGVKRTPLQNAAEKGNFRIAQYLIDSGALVNAQPARSGGATALQLAVFRGFIGIAELLLEHGAEVNAPGAKFDGRTALEGAAEHGRIDMLRLLFNAGANFHGSEYERAMQLAKENGHMATRRYLETLSKTFPWSILKE